MSREWFQLAKHPFAKPRRDAFADPLQSEEWRGLGWAVALLSWAAKGRRPARRGIQVATERRIAAA